MLRHSKDLLGYRMVARDGNLGAVKEMVFDDKFWTIRYFYADPGLLANRMAMISPYAVGRIDSEKSIIPVNLDLEAIESCPRLGADEPISLEYELSYFSHFGWQYYGFGPFEWGASHTIIPSFKTGDEGDQTAEKWSANLRRMTEVTGYTIHALDDDIGVVADFLIEDETWTIRYLVIDTGKWLPGKQVLIAPQWIHRISWSESKVFVNVTREAIKSAPEYKAGFVNRAYEIELYRHFDEREYWDKEPVSAASLK